MSSKRTVASYWQELAEQRLNQIHELDAQLADTTQQILDAIELFEHMLAEDQLPTQLRAHVRAWLNDTNTRPQL